MEQFDINKKMIEFSFEMGKAMRKSDQVRVRDIEKRRLEFVEMINKK